MTKPDPTKTAIIATAYCGCVIAAELEGLQESIGGYNERGLFVRWVTPATAKAKLGALDCKHDRTKQTYIRRRKHGH